jgi:hypothetical protein
MCRRAAMDNRAISESPSRNDLRPGTAGRKYDKDRKRRFRPDWIDGANPRQVVSTTGQD